MQVRQRVARTLRWAAASYLAILWASSAQAGTFPVFGPEDFVRSGGSSKFTRNFTVASPGATTYTLHIDNGGLNNQYARSTSAVVTLNGTVILPTSSFGQTVATIDQPVTLAASNRLDIELRSNQGSGLRLVILGQDDVAPALSITAPTQSLIVGNNQPAVSVAYSDALAGVDTTTLKIMVDGIALTGCTAGAASATCTPPVLADGHHTVTAEVKDRAGNVATASSTFQTVLQDTAPPVITPVTPEQGSFIPVAAPGILFRISDPLTGIDPATVLLLLDGVDRTAEARFSGSELSLALASPLAEGAHTVEVRARDWAGNAAQLTVQFSIDTGSPVLTIVQPSAPVLQEIASPSIEVIFSDAVSGIDPASLQIAVDGILLTSACGVTAASAVCQSPELPAGPHEVVVQANDRASNFALARFPFTIVLDREAPTLAIVEPAGPLVTGDSSPAIRLTYSDAGSGIDPASLVVSVDGAPLTGCQVGPSGATCEAPVLQRGPHTISARIADPLGNAASTSLEFNLLLALEIAFTEPAPNLLTPVPVVRVSGTVAAGARSVTVNGVAADLQSGTFTIQSLGLHDGVNDLIAVAEDAFGNIGTATVRVVADTTPPGVSVTFPANGATVATPTITVTGLVNDLTIGTVSDTQATVTVNGMAANVENRTYIATDVPLQPGVNTVRAVATDRAGNEAAAEVQVTLEQRTGVPTLQIVSGDGQTGMVSTQLPQPLVVGVTDAIGQPLPGAQVVFQVVQGSGVLPGGERTAVVPTNAQGRASIPWTLGTRAGVGSDRVRATAVGIPGEVGFVASAYTGVPAAINVASGDNQRGVITTELSRPLFAVVIDAGNNPVAGVPVTFRVVQGGGGFVESGGAATATVETDESGLASARLTLGPGPGLDNNLVEATFPELTALPAVFKQSGMMPDDPSQTRISGVVLDNQGAAVPGVTMRLRDSALTAVTDAQGKFLLAGVPVGQVFLIADATTASRPGSWASLEFELFTLAGVDNAMPRPIYILPLDLPNGVYVDETRGGTVTLPEIPGFSLEVAPGSVTFPGGGRSGVVSVTAVKADKIPMPPGAGMQPRLIVTVQPVGAHFDPPAPFTLPNVDGLPPGTVTELFSFDHDLGEFVSIGTGTVSADGLVVRSDPGFGITEGGWHCGAPPSGQGSGGSLNVQISGPRPVNLCAGGEQKTKQLVASGGPPLDAVYSWQSSNPGVVSLSPSGGGLCANSSSCSTQATGAAKGDATATVTLTCTTTGQSVSDNVPVKVTELKEFEIIVQTFIPYQVLMGPFFATCTDNRPGEVQTIRHLYYGGDGRGFDSGGGSYRTRQSVTVIPEKSCSDSGVKSGSETKQVGTTKAYANDAVMEASDPLNASLVPEALTDMMEGDCHWLHDSGKASSDGMNINVTREGEHKVKARLHGGSGNPLITSPEINWDFTIIIDSSGSQTTWTLEGEHDGFPAYEIYINGQQIYGKLPSGPGDINSLFPPMEIEVNTAGSLP